MTEAELQQLHELAMDYRGAVIVSGEWNALVAYIEGLLRARTTPPSIPTPPASPAST